MRNMILSRAAIWTAAALLAVIGAFVVLPQSADAGPRLKIKSVQMNITPTADATMDNKKVDISFTWRASRNATGYQIDRRERIDDLTGSLSFESEWTRWKAMQAGIRYCKKHDHQLYCTVSTKWARWWNGEFASRTQTATGAAGTISASAGVSSRSTPPTT